MKKISLLFVILISCVAISHRAGAILRTTYSVTSSTVAELEDWIDDNTIVFITLGEVLVRPDYKMFGFGINPYRNFESNLITRARRNKNAIGMLESWYNQRKLTLVEPEWKEFITKMRAKGALVFGVCELPLKIKDIEKKIFLEIRDLDVDFSPAISDKNVLVLGELGDWLSIFYQGIIFSGPLSKAKSIENLMKVSLYVPKKVVFFDVRNSAVKQVDRILRPFDMDFYSVVYNGIKEYRPEINFKEVEFQQRHFHETQILLSDDEVKDILQNNPDWQSQSNAAEASNPEEKKDSTTSQEAKPEVTNLEIPKEEELNDTNAEEST